MHLAEEAWDRFVAIDNGLRARGFSAPAIRHSNVDSGFLITEDFGSTGVIEGYPPRPIAERYEAATDMLAALHRETLPETLPLTSELAVAVFDIDAWLVEIELMLEWYLPDRGTKASHEKRETLRDVAPASRRTRGRTANGCCAIFIRPTSSGPTSRSGILTSA